MEKIKYVRSVILAIAISSAACEGPEGPVGPQGPQGSQGEQGTAGRQGTQGVPGTANVMYSEWMDVDWNYNDDATSKRMYIEEPQLLDEFMDTGTVLMYLKQEVEGLGKATVLLPYFPETNERLVFGIVDIPDEDLAGILIALTSTDGAQVTSDWSTYQVRYVLIPGGVLLSEGRSATIDYSDYEAVKAWYGIQD